MPAVDIDREAAHEAAQHELAKPIYPHPSLIDMLTDWLDDQLNRLTRLASNVPGGWFTVTVLLVIVAVAVVVGVRMARRTMRANRGDRPLFGAAELTAAAHRASAQQCAARGDWGAAIRHRLRAVARRLEESGALTPIPGRTAGELARDAGAEFPTMSGQFNDAASAFNDVAYGELPGTAQAYQIVADLDDHLDDRLGERAGGPAASTPPNVPPNWTAVR